MKSWRWRSDYPAEPESTSSGANSDRARLFARIVNELRTPLSVIMGQIDAALVETDANARAHQLRVANRNTHRLARLADQAMDLTRLEQDAFELRKRRMELVQFVESLVMSFEDLAVRNGIVLEFISRRQSLRGASDPHVLTTIISNLMSNAIKFTPAGGRIGVALDFVAPDHMRITVVDTGAGISPDRHADIFSGFAGQTSVGAGIGLALARAMARLHGGDIDVVSELDKGSRFDVVIPIGVAILKSGDDLLAEGAVRPPITEEILFRSTVESPTAGVAPNRDAIVVVDANTELRRWVAEILNNVANVDGVADCASALQLCRETVPDLVLVDDRDDGSDGIEFVRAMRADERTSHAPILLMSAHNDSNRRASAFDQGAEDYLAKPLDAEELRARVSGLLSRQQALRVQFRQHVEMRPAEIVTPSAEDRFLHKVRTTIESALEDPEFSVQDLGDAVAMSTSQLSRKLRALLDQSPAQLIRAMRMQRAADLIAANAGQISAVCFEVGFSDQSHFSRTFKRHFGLSPLEYRQQQNGDREDA